MATINGVECTPARRSDRVHALLARGQTGVQACRHFGGYENEIKQRSSEGVFAMKTFHNTHHPTKPIIERRPLRRALAEKRQQIPGAQRMLHALLDVEDAQAELRNADNGLRAALTIVSLNKAFNDFQTEGGVTAADWRTWLNGEPLRQRNVLPFKGRPQPVPDEPDDDEDEDEPA